MPKPDPGPAFWALIEPYTGPIHAVHPARDTGPHATSLQREAAINPYVRTVTPALRWQ